MVLVCINWFLSDDYGIGKDGSLCQTGTIYDEIECKNVVTSFYINGNITKDNSDRIDDGSWVESDTYFPKGCYLYDDFAYFNKADFGRGCFGCHPICREGKPRLGRLHRFPERI